MKNLKLILAFILLMGILSETYPQDYIHDCPHSQQIEGQNPPTIGGLYKPERTDYPGVPSYASFKVLLVFVQFAGETGGGEWPGGQPPTYMNKLLAQNINTVGNYWDRYDQDNEQLSDWYQEVSKGHMHVIGNAYNIILTYDANHYLGTGLRDMNQEIYDKLYYDHGVRWQDYDNWSGGYGNFSLEPDTYVDMIIKVHRTRTVSGLFLDDAAGYACLGPDIFSGEDIPVPGNKKINDGFTSGVGSGVTIVGTVQGPASKSWVFNIAKHEIGHCWFGSGHTSAGVGIMGGGDIYLGAFESIRMGYLTSKPFSFNTTDYSLYDISSRNSNGEILQVPINGDGEFFMITNRRQISYYDRTMLGDTAYDIWNRVLDPAVDYGKGVYIYHHYSTDYWMGFPEESDMECADGLWNWVQNGFDAPDWDQNNYWLPILIRTQPVREANDDGKWTSIVAYPEARKDGRNVAGRSIDNKDIGKCFSVGKKLTQNSGQTFEGIDRIYTNYNENWTSREYEGDRWDAWKKGYNEIFSPYSSPSTYNWDNNNTGIFIWLYSQDENVANFKIYKTGSGGYNLTQILAETPPSRPMGIKHDFYFPSSGWCYPKITWEHNTEPDMLQSDNIHKRYKIYRATSPDMSTVPGNYVLLDGNLYIPNIQTPEYIDYSILEYDCGFDQVPPFGTQFPVRYRVTAVDNSEWESVPSDFVETTGLDQGTGRDLGGEDNPGKNNNIPKEFKLSQNYPNPFNPVTNIKYDLPKNEFVAIKIYDLLGREIKTLINEFKNAGSYIVSFNGSEFASGIYFYRIQAGNFVQVKKMALIK
jgi:hypothetical protein